MTGRPPAMRRLAYDALAERCCRAMAEQELWPYELARRIRRSPSVVAQALLASRRSPRVLAEIAAYLGAEAGR